MNISSLLQFVASFAWIGLIGVIAAMFIRTSRNQPSKGLATAAVVLLVLAVLMTTVGAGLVFIEPDDLAIVVTIFGNEGIRSEPLTAGLHWIIPFAERVERFSILNQTYT
ncbi:MAG: hypothetical protein ACK40V_11235, partial [Anaerolineales bacterium]